MKLVESIMTKNPCYTAGKKINVKGLMLHSVGCSQPSASAFIKTWNSASYTKACVHGFIDANDGTVYQTLPWNHRGWHCGASGNNTHIGVEMCEPACIKYTSGANFTCSDLATAKACAKRTYGSAVQLFAMLCKQYNLNPTASGVIVSHKEGYARGIASNHGDPEHLWKGLGLSYTMDGFRKDVKAAMGSTTTSSAVSTTSSNTTTTSSTVKTSGGVPYLVRVKVADLNMRKGPGVNYAKVGKYTGKGTFTIVEEKTGKIDSKGTTGTWGRLKSGNYWICLAYSTYTEKV
jgi:N-acetylmuramoyl-L-alanine amidase CwlA